MGGYVKTGIVEEIKERCRNKVKYIKPRKKASVRKRKRKRKKTVMQDRRRNPIKKFWFYYELTGACFTGFKVYLAGNPTKKPMQLIGPFNSISEAKKDALEFYSLEIKYLFEQTRKVRAVRSSDLTEEKKRQIRQTVKGRYGNG